ncbi:hypothetical protein SAMN04487833_1644 [Sarcina sp. DSM 11001]|uniref:DUF6431 domain-containing protein n=1 Tax=Sarcina sp. DSM 11001 TaxID=1798184 RepID=UPI000881001D|nr:DUF6431 domain-containing protein [Sarcina sp. DSM 11001]SDM07860.1 hypothetical protein SAMN04487833_1644 [Sarcina sp. DSM 11001]
MFLPDGRDYLCPTCKEGMLRFHDHCMRSIRHSGGGQEWIEIPRHRCSNPRCKRIHRMLPDRLLPYKHYEQPVIRDSLDGCLDPGEAGNAPSAESIKRWGHWLMSNSLDIEGYVKSIAHRELRFSGDLLKTGISLLEVLKKKIPQSWLSTVIRIIYNAGGFLRPFYG